MSKEDRNKMAHDNYQKFKSTIITDGSNGITDSQSRQTDGGKGDYSRSDLTKYWESQYWKELEKRKKQIESVDKEDSSCL